MELQGPFLHQQVFGRERFWEDNGVSLLIARSTSPGRNQPALKPTSLPPPPLSLYHNQGFVLSVNWIYFYFYFYMTIRQVNEHICHGTVALLFKCGDDDSSSPEGPPRAQSSFPPRAMCLSPVTTGSVQSHTFSVVQIFPEGGCLQMLTIRLLLTMPNVIHILHIHSSYTIYEV